MFLVYRQLEVFVNNIRKYEQFFVRESRNAFRTAYFRVIEGAEIYINRFISTKIDIIIGLFYNNDNFRG